MTIAAQGVGGGITSQGVQAGRRCRVEIFGPPKPDDGTVYNLSGPGPTFFATDGGNTREKLVINEEDTNTGLRVKFSLEWSAINWTYNIGSVEIFGLSEAHRAFVTAGAGVVVVIYAGYTGQDLVRIGTISCHQVSNIPPSMSEPTWVTKFEGGDGGRAFGQAKINASFAPGTPMSKVTEMLGNALGKFSPGSKAAIAGAAGGRSFANGYAYSGKAAREFRAMLEDLGLEHTIQNEEIIIAQRGQPTQTVVVLTSDSGLIGSPAPMAPQPGKPKQWKIVCLLNGQLRPNCLLLIQAVALEGRLRVIVVKHSGDTYGSDDKSWASEMTVQQVKA